MIVYFPKLFSFISAREIYISNAEKYISNAEKYISRAEIKNLSYRKPFLYGSKMIFYHYRVNGGIYISL